MKILENKNLKIKLVGFLFLAGVLPVLFVGIFLGIQINNRLKEEVKFKLTTFSDEKTLMINNWFKERRKDIKYFSLSKEVGIGLKYYEQKNFVKWRNIKKFLNNLFDNIVENNNYDYVFLVNKNGKIIFSTENYIKDISREEYFRKALNGKINFSKIYYDEKINDYVMNVASPVYYNKQIIGVIVIGFRIKNISEFIYQGVENLGKSGESYRIDENRILLTKPKYDKISSVLKKRINSEMAKRIEKAIHKNNLYFKDYLIYKNYRGVKVAGVSSIIQWGDYKAGFIVEINYEEAFSSLIMIKRLVISVLLIIIVLIIITGVLFANSIIKPLQGSIDSLTQSASQISSASMQVAVSAQKISEGANQQSSSIEETASSLKEISSLSKQNAEISDEAERYMKETAEKVNIAGKDMTDISNAMNEISEGGEDIRKIIKTIDEIAFQTNLLSLNAAVEAARAGEAGAGFAVVADEVRNLAQRSAESAKNTEELIENMINRIQKGKEIVTKSQDSFQQLITLTEKVEKIVENITEASKEQSKSIEDIDEAINQLEEVSEENAAISEETASASEELTSQAKSLLDIVKKLQEIIEGKEKAIIKEIKNMKKISSADKIEKNKKIVTQNNKKLPGGREIKPDEIIPLDEEESEFKEF